jgi:hypothetical protein
MVQETCAYRQIPSAVQRHISELRPSLGAVNANIIVVKSVQHEARHFAGDQVAADVMAQLEHIGAISVAEEGAHMVGEHIGGDRS